MWSRKTLKQKLEKQGIHPTRSKGQNFMTDRNFLEFMVKEAGVDSDSVILEIGTGPGHLTDVLLKRGCRVIGVEVDEKMTDLCREQTGNPDNLSLYEGDVLQAEFINPDVQTMVRNVLKDAGKDEITLLSNLPYRRGPNILIATMETNFTLSDESLVVLQKELAEKLSEEPGTSSFGIPSVLFQWNARMNILRNVPAEVFWPEPTVQSVLCNVQKNGDWVHVDASGEEYKQMKKVVQTLFRHPRKTLRNNIKLSDQYSVDRVDMYGDFVDLFLDKRPEQLTPKEWYDLAGSLVRSEDTKNLDSFDLPDQKTE